MKTLPLSPIRLHILLSLVNNPGRPRDIINRVTTDTFGEIVVSAATLHDNLQIMVRHGWIELLSDRRYSLTIDGYDLMENDLYRWQIVTSRAIDTLRSRGLGVPG